MIKLVVVIPFILVGVVIGWLFSKLPRARHGGVFRCIVAGIVGSFLGLFFSDIADIRLFDNITNALLFSALGAVALILLTLLLTPKAHSGD